MAYGFAFGVPVSLYRALINESQDHPTQRRRTERFWPLAHLELMSH